ncbi:unnamed protein product, partial [marine sediment metagenome]
MEKRPRPKVLDSKSHCIVTGCGKMYVTPASNGDGLFEVFAWLGKSGGCAKAQIEAITRLTSLALRYWIPPSEIVKQLKGIRC